MMIFEMVIVVIITLMFLLGAIWQENTVLLLVTFLISFLSFLGIKDNERRLERIEFLVRENEKCE